MAALCTGLPGEAGDKLTVCVEFYHLGLPAGFSGGGCFVSDGGTADEGPTAYGLSSTGQKIKTL